MLEQGEPEPSPGMNTTRRLVGSCRKLEKLSRLPSNTRRLLLGTIAYLHAELRGMALPMFPAFHGEKRTNVP
jgi:hypothetical protein